MDPVHDSDLKPQPQSPMATATKFPACGLQQPQPQPRFAGRGCSCCLSEISDFLWAISEFSDIYNTELRFNWERSKKSVVACVGRPPTATTNWLQFLVAVGNRCRVWVPLLIFFLPDEGWTAFLGPRCLRWGIRRFSRWKT